MTAKTHQNGTASSKSPPAFLNASTTSGVTMGPVASVMASSSTSTGSRVMANARTRFTSSDGSVVV